MTSGLRKIHKYSWIAVAIILPILIWFSLKNRVVEPLETKRSEAHGALQVKAGLSHENEFISARRVEIAGVSKLEIKVKTPLKHASSVVYALNEDSERGIVLGQLQGKGSYLFEAPLSLNGIIIYDPIKETEVTKLHF